MLSAAHEDAPKLGGLVGARPPVAPFLGCLERKPKETHPVPPILRQINLQIDMEPQNPPCSEEFPFQRPLSGFRTLEGSTANGVCFEDVCFEVGFKGAIRKSTVLGP